MENPIVIAVVGLAGSGKTDATERFIVRGLVRVEAYAEGRKNIVIESLYSWSEYKIVKERFGDSFKVLAIYAPPSIRYERLGKRKIRPLSPEEARARDYAEIENIEKAGPITMGDWTIQNTG